MSNEYARWLAYPVMILVGVPLYICASASTPIAAALVARGFSPGAALIFLMTGPATNTSTIAIIMSQFGTRFATIYVMSVIVVTAIFGITIDLILQTKHHFYKILFYLPQYKDIYIFLTVLLLLLKPIIQHLEHLKPKN